MGYFQFVARRTERSETSAEVSNETEGYFGTKFSPELVLTNRAGRKCGSRAESWADVRCRVPGIRCMLLCCPLRFPCCKSPFSLCYDVIILWLVIIVTWPSLRNFRYQAYSTIAWYLTLDLCVIAALIKSQASVSYSRNVSTYDTTNAKMLRK